MAIGAVRSSDLGRTEEAVASYERAVALMPDSIGDWINFGTAQHQLGRHEQALAATTAYWRCSRTSPRRISTAATSSRISGVMRRRWRALTRCSRQWPALRRRIEQPRLCVAQAGPTGRRAGKFRRGACALTPNHVSALINRGIALKDLGRLDDAVASYERALALDPDRPMRISILASSAGRGDTRGPCRRRAGARAQTSARPRRCLWSASGTGNSPSDALAIRLP